MIGPLFIFCEQLFTHFDIHPVNSCNCSAHKHALLGCMWKPVKSESQNMSQRGKFCSGAKS